MTMRVTVNAIIRNRKGEILLCKMPQNRGAYPGQWAIPGGGIDAGEEMRAALKRELREEVGLEVTGIEPVSFDDATREKIMADGHKEKVYMIMLVFECRVGTVREPPVQINAEFEEYAWVSQKDVWTYDLNEATMKTFKKLERNEN